MTIAANEHVLRIASALDKGSAPSFGDVISRSWKRSIDTFHIDPASKESLHVLTSPEVSALRDQSAMLVRAAQPEIDRLYQIVRPAGYVVLLTDRDGVVIDHRGSEEGAEEFKRWGLWLGRVWSENLEGTNGIGTALVDNRPMTIHRSQHFRLRHTSLSCSGAPIFDAGGALVGVIDVSCFDPGISDGAHDMTGPLTIAVARGIEERLFRARFQKEWVVAIARPDKPGIAMLLAVDDGHHIVGANRDGRAMLEKAGLARETGAALWTIFARNDALFRRKNSGDVFGRLTCLSNGADWGVIVTPPLPASTGKFRLDVDSLFWRPRVDALLAGRQPAEPGSRLGLTPATLRRIRSYVESHIDGDLSLSTLAKVAGLSLSHFARAFKKSEGMTPSGFVLECRVERARKLLLDTTLPLSEIAIATGFSDQSHLARRFRQRVGVAPSQFRRSQD
jgi:AraC-like DNA-binding protein